MPEKPAKKKLTTSDILKMKKGRRKTITIQLDGDLANQIEQLEDQIRQARIRDRKPNRPNVPDEAPALMEQLDQLVRDNQDSVATFTFASIGRAAYDELVNACPPSDEQRKEQPGIGWNPETFPPALVAAASFDPKISEAEALEIWNSPDWNGGEVVKLFSAALEVNTELPKIPFSNIGIAPNLNSD